MKAIKERLLEIFVASVPNIAPFVRNFQVARQAGCEEARTAADESLGTRLPRSDHHHSNIIQKLMIPASPVCSVLKERLSLMQTFSQRISRLASTEEFFRLCSASGSYSEGHTEPTQRNYRKWFIRDWQELSDTRLESYPSRTSSEQLQSSQAFCKS